MHVLGILVLPVIYIYITMGMASMCAHSICMVESSSLTEGIALSVECIASKHFMSDIFLVQSFDANGANALFNTAASTNIASGAVGTVEYQAYDKHGFHVFSP